MTRTIIVYTLSALLMVMYVAKITSESTTAPQTVDVEPVNIEKETIEFIEKETRVFQSSKKEPVNIWKNASTHEYANFLKTSWYGVHKDKKLSISTLPDGDKLIYFKSVIEPEDSLELTFGDVVVDGIQDNSRTHNVLTVIEYSSKNNTMFENNATRLFKDFGITLPYTALANQIHSGEIYFSDETLNGTTNCYFSNTEYKKVELDGKQITAELLSDTLSLVCKKSES